MGNASNRHDGATLKAVTVSVGTAKPLSGNTTQKFTIIAQEHKFGNLDLAKLLKESSSKYEESKDCFE